MGEEERKEEEEDIAASPPACEDEEEALGIPETLRVRRPYTLSPAALEARRLNAQKSTGPRTPEGKAISGQNGHNSNWKHGLYSNSFLHRVMGVCHKRCKRHPCDAVDDGRTKLGEMCLDHDGLPEKIKIIVDAAETGDIIAIREMHHVLLAVQTQITERMQRAVLDDGEMVREPMVDKDGNIVGYRYKAHPLLALSKASLADLGITWTDMLLTAKSRLKDEGLGGDININLVNYARGGVNVGPGGVSSGGRRKKR